VSNGKITITKGTHFSHNDDYITHCADNGANRFLAYLQTNSVIQNRVQLSTVPVVFLHCKIELLPNLTNVPSYYNFIPAEDRILSAYTPAANTPIALFRYYDEEIFFNSDTLMITTAPLISSISPISAKAGNNEIVTIKGANFGTQRGKVFFKAANDGGQTYLKDLDDYYYLNPKMNTPLEWSNNTIQVVVPSLVMKGYESVSKTPTRGAGTGTIQIKTALDYSCTSPMLLQIPYSITNDTITMSGVNKFQRVYLARKECGFDFLFTLAPTFKGLPDLSSMVSVIDTALRHLSELTGLTLKLDRKPNGELQYADEDLPNLYKKYVIARTSIINPQTEAMGTGIQTSKVMINSIIYLYCNFNSGILINPMPENNTPPHSFYWDYKISGKADGGKASFYQCFLHEVGHILLLGHVIDSTQLMHYIVKTGHNIITQAALAPTVTAIKDNISKSRSINWELAIPSYPPLYPVQVLKTSFTITKSCYGANNGSIKTTVTGGKSPYTCIWKKNGVTVANTQSISNLSPGVYTLQLNDMLNCVLNDTITIQEVSGNNPLTLSITKIPATPSTLELWRANVSGGVSPYSYKWTAGFVEVLIGEEEPPDRGSSKTCPISEQHENTQDMPTKYHNSSCGLTITVTDNNGCQIFKSPPSAKGEEISINDIANEIILYPNPTAGSFTISNITDATIYIYSSISGHIKTFEHVSNNETINIDNLSNGTYFLKIVDGNKIKNEKLILTK
jgi:hypothetical protein